MVAFRDEKTNLLKVNSIVSKDTDDEECCGANVMSLCNKVERFFSGKLLAKLNKSGCVDTIMTW